MDHTDQRQQLQHQNQLQQQPATGFASNGQMAYAIPPYQPTSMVATGTPAMPISSPTSFPHQQHLAYHQSHPFQTPQQHQQLQAFWANQSREIEQTTDFKNHSLPLARIKKIMKADEDVKMISAEAPVIFAKACEMFTLELTLRSWIHTEENKRRTLQRNDIAAAISRTDVFDFLVDIIPRDELKEEGLGITKGAIPMDGSPTDGLPYYYMPPQQLGAAGTIMEQPQPTLPFMAWPHSQTQSQQQPSQQNSSG